MKNLLTTFVLAFAVALTYGCESQDKDTDASAAAATEDTSDVYVEPLVLDEKGNVVEDEKKNKPFWSGWFKDDKKDGDEVAMAEEDDGGWSLFGGGKDEEEIDPDEIPELSPELKSLAHTPAEYRIRKARTIDTNLRALNDDVHKVLLLDRPSRIGVTPIP